jgi:hypothetical protein
LSKLHSPAHCLVPLGGHGCPPTRASLTRT